MSENPTPAPEANPAPEEPAAGSLDPKDEAHTWSTDMTGKLFVGGLAGNTTSEDLQALFEPVGKLKLGKKT